MVIRVGAATTIPGTAAAFQVTSPGNSIGDRMLVAVMGKYDTTTIPTISAGWTLIRSGTGGTGTAGNDTGLVFVALYAKDATALSETGPTITPGATAPNSWVAIMTTYRYATGKSWRDAIAASAPWTGLASDTNTASPLTGAVTLTNQPTAGDAIAAFGTVPTDLGTAQGASTIIGTGLSGGTVTADSYVENALGTDSAGVHLSWAGFTGTATGAITPSFLVTGAANLSGAVMVAALREKIGTPTGLTATGFSTSQVNVSWNAVSGATSYILERSDNGSTGWTSIYTGSTTSFSDTGRSSFTTYYYRVSSTDGVDTSPVSATVSGKTSMGLPVTEDFSSGTWSNWTRNSGTNANAFTISGGAGVMASINTASAGAAQAALTDVSLATTDQGVLLTVTFSGDSNFRVTLRGDKNWLAPQGMIPNNGYIAYFDTFWGATFQKTVNGTQSAVTGPTTGISWDPAVSGTPYKLRFEVVGTTLRSRVWPAASAEPSIWWQSIDSSIAAGALQFAYQPSAVGTTATIDDILYYDPNAGVAPTVVPPVRRMSQWR